MQGDVQPLHMQTGVEGVLLQGGVQGSPGGRGLAAHVEQEARVLDGQRRRHRLVLGRRHVALVQLDAPVVVATSTLQVYTPGAKFYIIK